MVTYTFTHEDKSLQGEQTSRGTESLVIINWHDLLCCCIPIKPLSNLWVRSDQTTSFFHRYLQKPYRSPLSFQHQTVQPVANMVANTTEVFRSKRINIWPGWHCHLLFLRAPLLAGMTFEMAPVRTARQTECEICDIWNVAILNIQLDELTARGQWFQLFRGM